MTPTGYNETTPNTTADTNDSDADPTTGNAPVTNLVSGESDQTIDAGIYRPATIGDYVWRDTDGDGIQDPTELGINGVTVLLKDATTLAVLQTTVTTNGGPTGGAGYYNFTVDQGTYVVMFATTGNTLSPTGNGTTTTDSRSKSYYWKFKSSNSNKWWIKSNNRCRIISTQQVRETMFGKI
ncbi:MAG: hypothetical protein IPL98_15075 [Saprospiraceae bacterium]|nr:hypothetical protein [Saprospiraceae bacterium]